MPVPTGDEKFTGETPVPLFTMLDLEEALHRILAAVQPLEPESVDLPDVAGRVPAESLVSAVDLPLFDNSAMDGYAVRAEDLKGTGAEKPAALRLIGKVAAGEVFDGTVESGTCLRVFTGSPLPRGSDAVVMQEDTAPDSSRADLVWVRDTVQPWENVRLQGQDIKRGAVIAEAGQRLNEGRVGLLAAAGLDRIKAIRQPRVALLSTGSELIEAGQPPAPGKIYESNRALLAPLVTRAGGVARIHPVVPDDLEATRAALESALDACDVAITSGGVSVGDYDFVKAAFEKLGGELAFWKVAIRPGKPFVFGRAGRKCLFGLPGNPVSAFVTFLLLVRPALAALQGARETNLPRVHGVLTEPLSNPGERRHFLRVIIDDTGGVRSAGAQASHSLYSLAQANGLVDMPPRTALNAGAPVSVLQWDN